MDDEVELAGELALAWCLRQIEEVEQLFPLGDGTDNFRCGFSTACEEMKERVKAKRFGEILDTVVAGVARAD